MKLADLQKYRVSFIGAGVKYPLMSVAVKKQGLLAILPVASSTFRGWPWTEQTDPSIYHSRILWPKITIVTPSFNQGQFIEETIRSVLLQNYPNLEYIIVDGGSTDGTQDILSKYSPWLSFWQSKEDNGQGHAINLGFSLASGAYLAWINSDDYYLKNVFHDVVNKFLATKAQFIYGYGYNKYPGIRQLEEIKILPFWDFFIKIPGLIQPSAFWSAEIHKPVWEELHCSLDFELWLRLVKGKRRLLIKRPLSVTHIHEAAKTSNPEMKPKWHEDHLKIWSEEGHGKVYEWQRIIFFNRVRSKIFKILKLL